MTKKEYNARVKSFIRDFKEKEDKPYNKEVHDAHIQELRNLHEIDPSAEYIQPELALKLIAINHLLAAVNPHDLYIKLKY